MNFACNRSISNELAQSAGVSAVPHYLTSMLYRRHRRAFTLVELLTVIAIVAILGALVIAGVGAAKQSAKRAGGVSSLRQLGASIELYAQEHDGSLPGPLWPGQVPVYQPERGEADGRLAGFLAPYLEVRSPDNRPVLVDVMVPPAYPLDELYQSLTDEPRTYVMNTEAEHPDRVDAENYWGDHPVLAEEPADAIPAKRFEVINPSKTWAIMDADQQHPRVSGAPWSANTPESPIHEGVRHALFFDGRVEAVDVAQGLPE